jgi:hypothetical protein
MFVVELCGLRQYVITVCNITVNCNDIRPQTAQFYNERISTDRNLVTWQSAIHEAPEDGLKNGTETCRGKFLSVLM